MFEKNINKKNIFRFQSGQVLLLGLSFTCISILLTLIYFNTAQTEYERQQATNIADAAVYSGLKYQARSINFLAYTNRALIANHVSVGQIVSTSSWLDYTSQTLRIVETIASFFPVVGDIIKGGANVTATVADQTVQLLPALITHTDTAIRMLGFSQTLVWGATPLTTTQFIENIIAANDPRYTLTNAGKVGLAKNATDFIEFFNLKSDEDSLDRLASTISSSLDNWASDRSHLTTLFRISSYLNTSYGKTGNTLLVKSRDSNGNPKWVWNAKDAGFIEIVTPRLTLRGLRKRTKRLFLPNRAFHSTGTRSDLNQDPEAHLIKSHYAGLTQYLDLADANTLSLFLELGIPHSRVRKTETLASIGAETPVNSNSNLNLFHLNAGPLQTSAVSKGEIFFERPTARKDGKIEYSNLFTPYWIVRLTPADVERNIIRAAYLAQMTGG